MLRSMKVLLPHAFRNAPLDRGLLVCAVMDLAGAILLLQLHLRLGRVDVLDWLSSPASAAVGLIVIRSPAFTVCQQAQSRACRPRQAPESLPQGGRSPFHPSPGSAADCDSVHGPARGHGQAVPDSGRPLRQGPSRSGGDSESEPPLVRTRTASPTRSHRLVGRAKDATAATPQSITLPLQSVEWTAECRSQRDGLLSAAVSGMDC